MQLGRPHPAAPKHLRRLRNFLGRASLAWQLLDCSRPEAGVASLLPPGSVVLTVQRDPSGAVLLASALQAPTMPLSALVGAQIGVGLQRVLDALQEGLVALKDAQGEAPAATPLHSARS
jgi:hypothetical protein